MARNDGYVTAAFKSVREDEAYVFIQKEFLVDNYAPGRKDDTILCGPDLIGDKFSSLEDTIFAEQGIDCAFASTQDPGVAYIFSGNQCAKWFYAPFAGDSKILEGPMDIVKMFHFLKGTDFKDGVDAAFESTISGEAYLFKGNKYARIKYGSEAHLISIYHIGEKWPCFKGTDFEYGFDAAFASHICDEAYVFKAQKYAKIYFTPGETFDEMLCTGDIKDFWNGLGSILPRYNMNSVAK